VTARANRRQYLSSRVMELPGALCVIGGVAQRHRTLTRVRCRQPQEPEGRQMAQKVTVVLEDDLTGGPAEQTVRFAFDGIDYEIDLNARNAAAFSEQLAPYLGHARRAGRAQPRRGGRAAAGRQRSGDIRAWAKEHGLAVSERGRIPASVLEQYRTSVNGR
jgi:hypothetical protein